MHPKILMKGAHCAAVIELEKEIVVYIARLPELERTENALQDENEFEEGKRRMGRGFVDERPHNGQLDIYS
jgi:hypothetical protein